jgi:hypothetical protein
MHLIALNHASIKTSVLDIHKQSMALNPFQKDVADMIEVSE